MQKINYETRYAVSPKETAGMNTEELRENFLVANLFEKDTIQLTQTHYDRYIAGGAMPVDQPLQLDPVEELKADFFLQRREIGIINIGGEGEVTVDGEKYTLQYKEALYIGKGSEKVEFASSDTANPAKFYFNSAPAHHTFPTVKVTKEQAIKLELGSAETANARTVNQLIVNQLVQTCQLQMGMTELKTGSVWNTMPAHVHDRRMEVYLYIEVPQGQSVCHFMGQPQETRHIWMQNEQAVISPPWSIHSGAGTSNYTFVWGMAGENLDYSDMDVCKIEDLK